MSQNLTNNPAENHFTQKARAFRAAKAAHESPAGLVVDGVKCTLDDISIVPGSQGYTLSRVTGAAASAPAPDADTPLESAQVRRARAATKAAPAAKAKVVRPAPAKAAAKPAAPRPVAAKAPAATPGPAPVAGAGMPDRRDTDSGSSPGDIMGNRAMVDLMRERGPAGATAAEMRDASGFKNIPPASWYSTLAKRNGFVLSTGTNAKGKTTYIATWPEAAG